MSYEYRTRRGTDFDRSVSSRKSVFRDLSHQLPGDADLVHFIDTTATVTYCKNYGVMAVSRGSAGYVRVL
jgi:hypothetical protein